jgi:hypothetical protein
VESSVEMTRAATAASASIAGARATVRGNNDYGESPARVLLRKR